MLEQGHNDLSMRQQCQLLGISRSNLYYNASSSFSGDLQLMKYIDEIYTKYPTYGYRKMTSHLHLHLNIGVNKKRVQRLMQKMRIRGICPSPKTSISNKSHKVYPYLLRDLAIVHPNQVWCTDITYIRQNSGFMYMVAIMDWYSRFILSWSLSNTMEADFCIEALQEALLCYNQPIIFNSDQGSQFTSTDFTAILLSRGILISMDGEG